MWSIGCPRPRSMASDSAASTSARRTRSAVTVMPLTVPSPAGNRSSRPVTPAERDGRVRRTVGHGNEVCVVTKPLYQVKAEFFKTLGHPARIRILELLTEREQAVSEMLPEVGIEAAHLSQQLAVLRRMNRVVSRRDGATVLYSVVSPHVGELLRVARTIIAELITNQAVLLDD